MYSQFSPKRVWDDFGRNSPPAIIPHLGVDQGLFGGGLYKSIK